MEKSVLRDIEGNIRIRVKGEVFVKNYSGWLYVGIASPDIGVFWHKEYRPNDLNDLTPWQIGRLVKDDYEKFITSEYFYT